MSDEKNQETGFLRDGCGLIAEERVRQKQKLGYTAEKDDSRDAGGLIEDALHFLHVTGGERAANLEKAGALIAAEIDRLRRIFQQQCNALTERDFGFTAFDSMDAYDLEQYDWVGIDPEDFIREHFAEDYDRLRIEK